MKACQIGAVLIIGMLTSQAFAGEQPQVDRSSIGAFANAQESVALQAIRWRVAESCYKNHDCASHIGSGANDRKFLLSAEAPSESPSTPERRRALGKDSADQR